MHDEAKEIFGYLPIRQSAIEARYVAHLWNAFEYLILSEDEDVAAFSLAPFHLLFMLVIQYLRREISL